MREVPGDAAREGQHGGRAASEPLVVEAAEGFRRWAPTYEETPLSLLEVRAFEEVCPPLAGRRLLDAGCGTGRRLPPAGPSGSGGPALAAGVDFAPAMLARAPRTSGRSFARAELGALPFRDGAFDLAWCRLTIGFLAELAGPFTELARVLVKKGELVLTDLHPDVTDERAVRSFHDGGGQRIAIVHHPHGVGALLEAASAAGLALEARRDLVVGPAVEDVFGDGAARAYRELLGRPVVLALRLRRV